MKYSRRYIKRDLLDAIERIDWRTEIEIELDRKLTMNQKLERALEYAVRSKRTIN